MHSTPHTPEQHPRPLRIALDYDNTFTADPELWRDFIRRAHDRGHDLRIVTIRDERFDRTPDLEHVERIVPVIFTRGVAKRWFCMHFAPDFWPVAVWIDDKPETILENSATTPEDLVAWRAGREPAST